VSAGGPDALISDFEAERARALGHHGRRGAGLYYTPPAVAERVVRLARDHGARGVLLDPCAGAGAFLLAAARAGFSELRGIDLDAQALRVARRALRSSEARVKLTKGDALRVRPRETIDCLVSNPPYGHVPADEAIRRAYPSLRGGEIDRYAVFILRALQLVRPGGVAALLVPDTWMFLARAGPLREEVLRLAQVAAAVDLGKPFAAAKDTRVQALVLVRNPAAARATFVGRGESALSEAPREELLATARRGWCLYRSREERALCEAMEDAALPLGKVCAVGYGLRTGDNARHVARRAPEAGEIGLAGGEDVTPFALRWKPKTLLHADDLRGPVGRQQGRARIAVQRIRTNATTPWAKWLEAAPVPRELVCLDSLSTLSAEGDLLWALLALVQSVALQRHHRLRTTDVNVKPGALRELPVPRTLIDDPRELADLARARARLSTPDTGHRTPDAGLLDRLIDARVYALFRLPRRLVEACERGFWAERFSEENQRLEQVVSDPSATVARKEESA
jgi:SAM-dependent methyltransferase